MGKLVVLMVTAFVDMIGTVMVIPLIPFYAARMGASGFMTGVLISAFSIAQLLSAPLWGRFSDRHGRRPTLLIGLFVSAISFLAFAYADSLWLLFASRVVQGLGGGTVGVIQAYVADSSAPEDRAKSLGWLSAATSAGVVIGPVIASEFTRLWGRRAPGLAAALFAVINLAFAWRYLRESRILARAVEHVRPIRRSRDALMRVLTHPGEAVSRLIWIYAIAIGAFYGMLAVLTLFLARRFQVTEQSIGYVFMWFGAAGVITRLTMLGPAVKWLGEARLCRAGLVLLSIGMGLFPLSHGYPMLIASITLMPLGTAFTFPAVTALLSRAAPDGERGLYMGVQQALGGVSRSLLPWWDGVAFDHLGMGVPFWSSGLLVVGALVLAMGLVTTIRAVPRPADARVAG
jgi:multidrug resistance protein